MWTFRAACEADTERLGRALAACLPQGAVVALVGPLGAGKTRLCRAVAEACGVAGEEIQSPTFVIVKEYHVQKRCQEPFSIAPFDIQPTEVDRKKVPDTFIVPGQRAILHLDLYRVRDEDELDELGFTELLASPAIKLIEWADRFPACLPHARLEIHIRPVAAAARDFEIAALGTAFEGVVARLQEQLG